jgi:hypothetical protein
MSRLNTGMELEGMEELNAEMEQLARKAPELALDIAELAMESLMSDAQTLAPVLTGFLVDQHLVERRPFQWDVVGVVNTNYAAAVHTNHPTKSGWLMVAILGGGLAAVRKAGEIVFGRLEGGRS